MKNFRIRGLTAWLLVCAMLASLLPVTALAEEDTHVHDYTTLVNGVCSCGTIIEATVTIGDTTTCYEKLEPAIAAAESGTADAPALVKLQRNWFEVKGQGELPTFGIRVMGGVFTLDFNDCTIFSRAEHIFQIGDPAGEPCNAEVTITDSSEMGRGRITGTKNLCAIYKYGGSLTIEKLKIDVKHESASSIAVHNELGDLTIEDGFFQVLGVELEESYAVKMDSGTENRISGGSFQGGDYDFYARGQLVLGLNPVTGVGASFPDGIRVLHNTVNALLDTGAAYWTETEMLTDIADDADSIADMGDITVKTTCDHSGNTNTEYRDHADGTHGLICSVCGYLADTQPHSGGSATCVARAVCEICGAQYGEFGEHDFEEGSCKHCGEEDPDWEEPSQPTDPDPTDPEPTDPEPPDPEPPDPEPTDPEPTDPEPSEPEDPADAGVVRLAGKDRYLTGFAVADYLKEILNVDKFDAVVIAYGQNFPDALTGSYLAAVKHAPILLTEESRDADVLVYLQQNLTSGGQVYILGGSAAVSQSFEDGAEALGFRVSRLKGANRYETNLAILAEAGVTGGDEILIATGRNYADSLSASATGLPMLLVEDALTEDQKAFLEGTSRNFVILGGTGAVSEAVEAELDAMGDVTRVKGSSRYGTSVAIAQRYFVSPEAAVLAYAEGFPDGLCGGPLAMAMGAPLILTSVDNYELADTYVVNIGSGAVTGGTARISDETVRAIFDQASDVPVSRP